MHVDTFVFIIVEVCWFFTKSNCNVENLEMFVNYLEALEETCLPMDETDNEMSQYPRMLSPAA